MKLLPGIGLILLGLAVGFVVKWAIDTGPTVSLFIGILLVLAGAALGFVIEWFIDEAHRRNRDQIEINVQATLPESVPQSEATVLAGFLNQREVELRELREKLSVAEKDLTDCLLRREAAAHELEQLPTLRENLVAAQTELAKWKLKPSELQTKLEAAQASLFEYREKQQAQLLEIEGLRAFKSKIEAKPDDLTVIKGIGKVYQQKLRDIGILSLKQLAEADPERIRRMLGVKAWQATDVVSWIAQALDWVQKV